MPNKKRNKNVGSTQAEKPQGPRNNNLRGLQQQVQDAANPAIDNAQLPSQGDAKLDDSKVPDLIKRASVVRNDGNKGQENQLVQQSGASVNVPPGAAHNEIERNSLRGTDEKAGSNKQGTSPTRNPEPGAGEGTGEGAAHETPTREQTPESSKKEKTKTKTKSPTEKPAPGSGDSPMSKRHRRIQQKAKGQTINQDWKALFEKEKKDSQKRIKEAEEQVGELRSKLSEAEETADSVRRGKEELELRELRLEEQYTELKSRHDETTNAMEEEKGSSQKKIGEFEKLVGELRSELSKAEERVNSVRREKEGELELRERQLKEKYAKQHDRATKTWKNSNEECEKTIASLRSQIEELMVSHIKSINSIAPGLEPISQQTIGNSFISLQHKVAQWAMKTFSPANSTLRPLQNLDPDIAEILSSRIRKSDSLSAGKLTELIVWGYLEQRVMSIWFPTMSPKNLQQLSVLETALRFGDNSTTHERVDFWRSYTASLLFQNPRVKMRLADTSDNAQAIELERLLKKVLSQSLQGSSSVISSLQDIITAAKLLAAQLRCQRGEYDIDYCAVGYKFDDERMFCLNNPDFESDEAGCAPVRAVISNAVVWRSFSGDGAVEEIISKARVLVDVDTNEGTESFHEAPTSPHSPTVE